MLETAAVAFKYFLILWLGILALRVISELLLKQNAMRGILSTGSSNIPDPERVILLLFTVGFAF